jgi:hypothetical protein
MSAFRGPKWAALLCLMALSQVGAQRAPADFEALPFAPKRYG